MTTRSIGLIIGLLIVGASPGAATQIEQGAPVKPDRENATNSGRRCAKTTNDVDAELRQFFPFLGEWRSKSIYKQESGPDLAGAGTEKIFLSVDGKAIEFVSEFEDPFSPGADKFISKAVWMVRPQAGALVGVGINSLGNRTFLEGAIEKGDLVVTVSGEMFARADQIERYRYHPTDEDRIEVSLHASADKGATWKNGWYEAAYERVRSGARASCD